MTAQLIEWALAAAFYLGFLGMFSALRAAQKRAEPPPEVMRKSAHVLLGTATLAFPWMFSSPWPVWALAAFCIATFIAMRRRRGGTGDVLHAVVRVSVGEIAFPVAVAFLFTAAGDRLLLYIVPVAILTFADAAGALAGVRYGTARYRTDEGVKSVEGSAAFFLVAFFTAHVPLLLFSGMGREECLLAATIMGLLVMLAEAAAWQGLDNVFVPVAAFYLLEQFMELTAPELRVRFAVAAGLATLALAWRSRTTLNPSAAMGGAFLAYVIWALGGWLWLLPPVFLFVSYNALARIVGVKQSARDFQAVLRVLAGPLVVIAIWRADGGEQWLPVYWIIYGAHLANVCVSRTDDSPQRTIRWRDLALYTVASWLLFAVPAGLLAGGTSLAWAIWLGGLVGIATSALLFLATRCVDCSPIRTWLWESGIAVVGGVVALIAIQTAM